MLLRRGVGEVYICGGGCGGAGGKMVVEVPEKSLVG